MKSETVQGENACLSGFLGRAVRLTDERKAHILKHPEMEGQLGKFEEALHNPSRIIRSQRDADVHLYHKWYAETPVTEKYLLVAIRVERDDAFVLTAFFTDTIKQGATVWEA